MGQETGAVVEFLDLYPTIIDYCGLKAPHQLSWKSLRPVLEEPSLNWENAAYTQVTRGSKLMGYSVRTDRWRYIQWGRDGEEGTELYDHSKDQVEYYNLADRPEYESVRKELSRLLKKGFPKIDMGGS
jgi:arylsulfatase A-like enzyme